ncbi:hypothetical protein B0T24DRAFT_668887 [Lasiosphaeria ovina]|uniref:Uncharacterized protein n=1 Tax=Lasiosphaeria ovina TaxID=92902 RepID=A0AAE0K3T7_9PEZI|nr:hypothetical protein B0T24DRAFT_668887 [Lasiosphaeria ovina]
MLAPVFTVVADFLASVAAQGMFHIPVGSPDGLYKYLVDAATSEVTLIYLGTAGNATEVIVPYKPLAGLKTRLGITGRPKMSLENWADATGGSFSSAISRVVYNAVAYGCDYGHGQNSHSSDIRAFYNDIDGTCDTGVPCWYSKPGWAASYGRTNTGTGFCF